jgi:hypothetical protein
MIIGLTSAVWAPWIQQETLEDSNEDAFICADYVSDDECAHLEDIYKENPDYAILQQNLMEPDNNTFAKDLGGANYYAEVVATGSSDPADIVPGRRGEFAYLDAIRKARGTAQLWEIVSFDGQRSISILRFEGILEQDFLVTNGLELAVYLAKDAAPPTSDRLFGVDGEGAVEINVLGGNRGSRDYEIPPDVDLTQYQSVVIYDRQLDIVFSYATLE